jgi:HAE1 family hydrophobic/amphiphilic exporter-1
MGARLAGVFAQQAGLRRVQVIGGEDRAESDWHIDADRAALSAIDTREIAHALQIARHGLTLGDVPDAAGQVRLRLHLTQSVLERAPGEPRLLVRGANADQPVVYLDELVQCQTWRTPPERWRERNGPMVEVRGTLASDAPVGPTVHGVRKALARMPIAPGYVRTYVGFVDNLQRVQIQAISLCALALVLALAVLAVRVPTRSQWFLALYGMIFTYGAVACVLPLSGYPLSLPGWLGGVLLATYAGILILVTLERFRRTAAPADVSQGVPLRAVLALAFCMLLCCLPFAFDLVPEFALVQPLAAILAMGIVAATLAAVFLLPVLAGPARE